VREHQLTSITVEALAQLERAGNAVRCFGGLSQRIEVPEVASARNPASVGRAPPDLPGAIL
jgi:hypothetical protein